MGKVKAGITTSLHGYVAGPDDGPGKRLGEGGERLHYWVLGGPWSYDYEPQGEPSGEDAEWWWRPPRAPERWWAGRAAYEAAAHGGDENPFGLPFFIVTHRPEEEPESGDFPFVSGGRRGGRPGARGRGDKDVNLMGGADVIRQELDAGLVDELTIIVAQVILGGGLGDLLA